MDRGSSMSLRTIFMRLLTKEYSAVLELIISKSDEDNFIVVVGGCQTSLENLRRFIRRLSVQYIDQESASALAIEDLSHVRSLSVISSVCLQQLPSLDKFEALRVLDIEDCEGLEEYIRKGMDKLLNLKYLSLRGKMVTKLPPEIMMLPHLVFLDLSGMGISSLPPEVQFLRCLQYLNLSGTGIAELPPEIMMLHDLKTLHLRETHLHELPYGIIQLIRLQHLLISSESWTKKRKWKIPVGIGNMRELLEMPGFSITDSSVSAVEQLGYLSSLRELRIQLHNGGSEEYKMHEEMLLSSLCKLSRCNLRYLWIHKGRGSLQFLDSWSPCPSSLETFRMSGDYCFTTIPKWITPELVRLADLDISLTESRDISLAESLTRLGELPALLYLKLSFVADPVQLITVQGTTGFKSLQRFVIYSVAGARVQFMEGAMPRLERLNLRLNVSLANYPGFELGIQHLPYLREAVVSLYKVDVTPPEIKAAAGAIRNEACVHPNRPSIDISGEFYEKHSEISSDEEDLR